MPHAITERLPAWGMLAGVRIEEDHGHGWMARAAAARRDRPLVVITLVLGRIVGSLTRAGGSLGPDAGPFEIAMLAGV